MRQVTTCLLVVVSLLLTTLTTWAQKNSSGKIIDAQTGQPLRGATIKVSSSVGTQSNENGEFSLSNLPSNTEYITISYVGFQTVKVPISQTFIILERGTYNADEVIVRATRVNEKSGLAYTDVQAEELQKNNLGQDLPSLLNWTPSMVTTSDAGAGVGYSGIRIRGSDGTRINMTINGIPYNDPESQGSFFVNMPDFASSVSSIQIQRGVGTSTNGAGAFGATININTNELHKDAYAEINNSAGSFGTLKNTIKVGTGLISDKFTFDARLSRIHSNGFVDRAKSNLQSLYLSGAYFAKKSYFRVNIMTGKEKTYQAWNGVPEAKLRNNQEGIFEYINRNGLNERDAQNLLHSDSRTYNSLWYKNENDNYQQDQYQLLTSHQLSTGLTLNVNGFYVRGRGFYEQFKDNARLSNYLLPNIEIGDQIISRTDLVRERWLDNHYYGTTFSLDYDNLSKLNWSIGGGWNQYDNDHYGKVIWARYASTGEPDHEYYRGNGFKTDFNLYAKAHYALTDQLTGYADVQFRQVDYTVTGTDNDLNQLNVNTRMNFWNPKVGLHYALSSNSTVYTSMSVGNREPNRNDFIDARSGTVPTHETMYDWEAGYKIQKSKWNFNANFYWMNYKNQLVQTGEINDVGSSVRINVPKSYRIGIELENVWRFHKQWTWATNLTLSDNKIHQFTEYVFDYDTNEHVTTEHGKSHISFSPNIIAGSQLMYTPVSRLQVALLSKYVGKQYLDNTSNSARQLDDYFINDFRLTWQLPFRWAKHVEATALVNNLLNVKYESNGYTYGYRSGGQHIQENFYFPQAGTNFLIGINIKL